MELLETEVGILCLTEIQIPDIFHGHLLSGPALKGLGPLREQHLHAVEGMAACFSGLAQKQRLPGIVNHIAHHQSGVEKGSVGNQ